MKALLRWWLIFCLSILAGGIAVYFDLHKKLYNADQTKLSFLILIVFILASLWTGWRTKKSEEKAQDVKNHDLMKSVMKENHFEEPNEDYAYDFENDNRGKSNVR